MIPDQYIPLLDKIALKNASQVGFVAVNELGQFLVTEPEGHPYGVSATFSKIARKPGESVSITLARCVREQVGLPLQNTFSLNKTWKTAQSSGFYFAGMVETGDPVSQANARLRWCSYEEAVGLIEQSANAASRQRDLGILAAASQYCYNPMRRVLYMLHELHKLGFERLRAPAYLYPLAWRCPIVPAYWTLKKHGGLVASISINLPENSIDHGYFTYSSSSGMLLFDWVDALMDTPEQLAQKFLVRRRELAVAGWGPDPAYAVWLKDALELTAPNGVYYAFGEDESPSELMYNYPTNARRLPLPPSGWITDQDRIESPWS